VHRHDPNGRSRLDEARRRLGIGADEDFAGGGWQFALTLWLGGGSDYATAAPTAHMTTPSWTTIVALSTRKGAPKIPSGQGPLDHKLVLPNAAPTTTATQRSRVASLSQ
jgi:hypothetical protein